MDFSQHAVADTATIHLKDAAGNFLYDDNNPEKPCRITVFGPGSEKYAEVESRQTNRALKRREDNDGKVAVASPQQKLAEQAEDLASVTQSFENIELPGKSGADLYLAIYGNRKFGFISNQVSKFVADWGNFNGGSATS